MSGSDDPEFVKRQVDYLKNVRGQSKQRIRQRLKELGYVMEYVDDALEKEE